MATSFPPLSPSLNQSSSSLGSIDSRRVVTGSHHDGGGDSPPRNPGNPGGGGLPDNRGSGNSRDQPSFNPGGGSPSGNPGGGGPPFGPPNPNASIPAGRDNNRRLRNIRRLIGEGSDLYEKIRIELESCFKRTKEQNDEEILSVKNTIFPGITKLTDYLKYCSKNLLK